MSDEDEKDKIENDSEENDNEIAKLSQKNKLKNNENLDNQEDNSEEDENYVEEMPQKKKMKKDKLIGNKRTRQGKKKKKNPKNKINMFIDREAEENENDEESIYEGGGELTKEQQKEEMAKAMKLTDTRFRRITEENEDEFLERIQQRDEEQKDEIEEENMYARPSSEDPKMWIVKCKIGDEKEIQENLYHKYFYFRDQKKDKKDRVKIFSVTSFTNLKGKIFIEAFTERDVLFAIQDMSNVYQNSIQLVPINERAQIFEYDQAPKSEVFQNQLVRIKGGNYDGDLAKVVYIEDPVNKIHIALVPRIFDNFKGKKGYNVAPFSKSKIFDKPRKQLFDKKYVINDSESGNTKTITEPYGEVTKYRSFKFMDGLLVKIVRRGIIETENVSPKEEELQKIGCYINEDGVYIDKNTEKRLTIANKTNIRFKKGDLVKVASENNEYNGQTGIVVENESGNKIKVEMELLDKKYTYFIPKSELVLFKHNFKDGDLVFAKFGSNKGRKGMVIQTTENGDVTVYDDVTKTKFKAKNDDLIFSEDMDLDNEENEMFKIGELVRIKNSNIVCYIIESTKYTIKVVTINNEVKELSVREVDIINLGKRITSSDGKGNPIDIDNTVKVIYGQYKGNKGVIKNIYNKYIFLLNYDFTRSNGIFCELKDNLELLGSELLLDSSDKGRVNHRRIPNEIKQLIGKTVHVEKGIWKGYNGLLIDGTDKNARLELIAKHRIVELPFDYIQKGDVNSAQDNNNESVSYNNQGFMKTPAYYIDREKWE